jgi:hypothetical protein
MPVNSGKGRRGLRWMGADTSNRLREGRAPCAFAAGSFDWDVGLFNSLQFGSKGRRREQNYSRDLGDREHDQQSIFTV